MTYKIVFAACFLLVKFSISSCRSCYEEIPKCQNITLQSNEYKILDGYLLTNYSNQFFPPTNYWQQTENNVTTNVVVCFPFSIAWIICASLEHVLWELESTEYIFLNNTSVLYDTVHKERYEPGNYQICPENYAWVCMPNRFRAPSEGLEAADTIFSTLGWILSAICTAVMFTIYLIVRRSVTDSKLILHHLASLFIAFFFQSTREFVFEFESTFACYVIGFGAQFGVISAVCWLNIVAFELWRKFRYIRLLQAQQLSYAWSRLLLQCIYGWGVPSLIIVISILFEIYKQPINPNYSFTCRPGGITAQWVLYYGPISVCMIFNTILFVLSVISLCQIRRYIVLANSRSQSQLLCMSVKLMLAMGIPWLLEVITWVSKLRPEYWIVANIITAYQGFFLTFIYITKNIREELNMIITNFLTDNCCFCIAKRVAITPFKRVARTYAAKETTIQSSISVI